MARKSAVCFLLLFLSLLVPGTVRSAEDGAAVRAGLLKKADEAVLRGEKKRADFCVARYLGLCEKEGAVCGGADLAPFLKKRQLTPKAFLPGDWDGAFLDWFEKSVRTRWGVEAERVREKQRSFEISQNTFENRYFATLVAYPELQLWHVVKDGVISRPMVLPMAGFRDRPTLFFGKILKGATYPFTPLFLDTQKRALHYVWSPGFFDIDGDGVPELWLRYNLAWGNGFSQVLDVYRIQDDRELVLFKRFQGDRQGFARRLPAGTVEVGTGFASRNALRAEPDRHKVETWEFREGAFRKTDEKEIPFLLKGPGWAEVYAKGQT